MVQKLIAVAWKSVETEERRGIVFCSDHDKEKKRKRGMGMKRKARGFLSICLVSLGIVMELWSAEAKTVRVGWYPAPGLQDGDDAASLGGYNYEYLSKIAQYEDWNCVFIFGPWGELEQKLINGEIDILGNVAKTEARLSKYDFGDYPNGYSRMLMACRMDDDRFSYNGYETFDGITVATIPSEFRKQLLEREAEKQGFRVQYKVYSTEKEMFDGLNAGQADVAIFSNITSYKDYTVVSEWEPNPYYFVVNKKRPDILLELNDGMMELQCSDLFMQERLFNKYFNNSEESLTYAMTKGEQDFIKRHQEVQVFMAKNEYPLSYEKDGVAAGIIPEYLGLLAEKSGYHFTFVLYDCHYDMIEAFKSSSNGLCAQIPDDFQFVRSIPAKLVQPYMTLTNGFVCYPSKANAIKKVATIHGEENLAAKLRDMGFVPIGYEGPAECLDAVVHGEADAALLSNILYEQISYHAKYKKLQFYRRPAFDEHLCIGISAQSDKYLLTSLEKTMGATSSATLERILSKTTAIQPDFSLYDYIMDHTALLVVIVILCGLVVILFVFDGRQRQFNQCLKAAKLEADRANEAKSSFLSMMSHDLRTPLNGIIGFTDIALKEKDVEKKQEYLGKIKSSGNLLLDLVNDTLDLSRIESGKMTLEPERTDFRTVGESVVTALRPSAELKDIRLYADPSGFPEGDIWADRLKLQKIFLNLLSNAIKYTPRGGTVWASIEMMPEDGNGRNVRMTVRDTGIGISEGFLPKLFQPFSQEHRQETAPVNGTGLGLAIMKRIVDMMGGEVRLKSEVDKGTTFFVELPIRFMREADVHVEELRECPVSLNGKRFLLCEDNEVNREIANVILKDHGVSVSNAEDGNEGLRKFLESASGWYDLILMDVRMPVMDGIEATKAIRSSGRSDAKEIPIIAMTADVFEETIRQCKEAGMNGFISKPFEPERMIKELEKQLDHEKQ